jgi:exodeoxyribonuclease VII large subunit
VADFVASLSSSGYAFDVELVHATVQGAAAESELIAALRRLERLLVEGKAFDAFVLVRGGGARGDLAVFDSRRLAEAIARASRPVLTGLGHEIDEAVADRVAHRAFKTPTAVAEFLAQRVLRCEERVEGAAREIVRAASRRFEAYRHRLVRVHDRLELVSGRLALRRSRLERLAERLASRASFRLRALAAELAVRERRLRPPAQRSLEQAARQHDERRRRFLALAATRLRASGERLSREERMLEQLSPRRVLARGFTITRDQHGALLRQAAQVAPGSMLRTELLDGSVASRVEGGHGGEG